MLPLYGTIHSLAKVLCRSDDLAADLVQESYLKAYRSFHTYIRDKNPKAWMAAILHNAYLDICRRRKIEPEVVDTAELPIADRPVAMVGTDLEKTASDELLKAFRQLSRPHQVLLILADIEGLRYQEIAEATGRPLGSVMSGLFYAREALRGLLTKKA